jgi:hypothetical protein
MDRDARLRLSSLWAALDEAIMGGGLAEHFVNPWESQNPAVRAAWEALTRPDNLSDLQAWLADDRGRRGITQYGEALTRKAIEDCRSRSAG